MKRSILFLLIILLTLSSCTPGKKPPTYNEIRMQNPVSVTTESETEVETTDPADEEAVRLREKHSNAAAAILNENKDTNFGTTVYGTQTVVECDGGIYIDCGIKICLLNRKTGYLQGLCNDPLCRHDSCIESHRIDSMVSDGDRLYFKGHSETYSEFS